MIGIQVYAKAQEINITQIQIGRSSGEWGGTCISIVGTRNQLEDLK